MINILPLCFREISVKFIKLNLRIFDSIIFDRELANEQGRIPFYRQGQVDFFRLKSINKRWISCTPGMTCSLQTTLE